MLFTKPVMFMAVHISYGVLVKMNTVKWKYINMYFRGSWGHAHLSLCSENSFLNDCAR